MILYQWMDQKLLMIEKSYLKIVIKLYSIVYGQKKGFLKVWKISLLTVISC